MGFVDDFIELTAKRESPESFWRWAAYAAVAATLRDHAYVSQGFSKLYPNIYVMFIATSAEHRKGAPFGPIGTLLANPKCRTTKIFRGRASIQGIIDSLSQRVPKGGITLNGGSCIIMAEELSSSFVDDTALIPLLTDMWEFKDLFCYVLRGTGEIEVPNLCVTLWGASNETLMTEIFTGAAVYGGLLGRTFIITPNETRAPNSLMSEVENKNELEPFVSQLKDIKDIIRGEFVITPAAKLYYTEWYVKLYHSYKKQPDPTGVLQRMHTNVLKLAMIKTASVLSMEITDELMHEAIEETMELRGNYRKFELSSGKNKTANIGAELLMHLSKSPNYTDSKRNFLSVYWKDTNVEELDELVNRLEQAGHIIQVLAGPKTSYRLSTQSIEKFRGDKKA